MSTNINLGVTPSALVDAARSFAIIGTAQVKASKVLALGAILSGAPTEDVSKRTGIAEATLKRIAGLARNGRAASETREAFTTESFTTAFRDLPWKALTTVPGEGKALSKAQQNAQYDASIATASFWDSFLSDENKSKGDTNKKTGEGETTDMRAAVYEFVVNAPDPAAAAALITEALEAALHALSDATIDNEGSGQAVVDF